MNRPVQMFNSTTHGVTFPLPAKLEVNGDNRDPPYAWPTAEAAAPDGPGDIQWSFARFPVGRNGRVRARYSPMVTSDDAGLVADVEAELAEPRGS